MEEIDRRRFFGASLSAGAVVLGSASSAARGKKQEELVPISDEPVTADDWHALRGMAEDVYAKNRVTLAGGTFHMPSRDLYISLFGWDSGWHAITMSRLDPQIAASEIEMLLNQQTENGRVPHETLFEEIEIRSSLKHFLAVHMGQRQYDEQNRSAFIDPPSYMVAAEKVFARTNDREWLGRILPRLERCAHYLTHDRDLFGDGLVSVVHPWETGTDSSPAYDEILKLKFKTPFDAARRGLMYPAMINRHADLGWDIKRIAEKNEFVLEDIAFNSITIRGLISIARLNQALGNRDKARAFREQAQGMIEAINRINWDEDDGCYFSRYDLKSPGLARRTTCSSMLPLFTGLISRDKADRIIREHLLNPEEFWLSYVVPFNAEDEMEKKVYLEDLLLWRGHCIWTNMNWMMTEGLLAYGYQEEARELVRRTAKMIRHEGFREFYDSRTGRGKGATNFNWPGLILDMICTTWPEALP